MANYARELIEDERVILEYENPDGTQPPSEVSSTTSFGYNVIQRTVREVFSDAVVAPFLVLAATDSRYYSEVADNTYRFLPIQLTNQDLKRIHGIDERISSEAYKKAIWFYYQLLINSTQ